MDKTYSKVSGVYIVKYPFGVQKLKIGWTTNPKIRFRDFNTLFCGEQELLMFLKTYDQSLEKKIFKIAQAYGFKRNGIYEVFDIPSQLQLDAFLERIETKFNRSMIVTPITDQMALNHLTMTSNEVPEGLGYVK